MKKHIYMLMALAAMTACSQEEVLPGADAPAGALTITVTDGGYAGESRAAEEGLTTVFTAGDRIGLFAVANGAIVDGINNVSLTANATGGWTSDVNHPLLAVPGATYYAYYPFTAQLPASVDPTATDAEGFFAPVVAAWNTPADQSDYAKYTSADLMTAKGVADGTELSFAMNHRMALVMVSFPSSRYVFTNTPAIPDYELGGATDIRFDGDRKPREADGKYAMLVNPALSDMSFSGKYNNGSEDRTWRFTSAAVAGTANTYTIDGSGSMGVVKHNLQVGDFFLSDGRLISKDAPAAEVAAADVVGIVYNIDSARIGDAEKAALGGKAHASVMAVKQISSPFVTMVWSDSQLDETEIGLKNICGNSSVETYPIADGDISGLWVNNLIAEKRPDAYAADKYEAFSFARKFGADDANHATLQARTTGWYLPAIGQWFDIVRNLGKADVVVDGILGSADLFYWKKYNRIVTNINSSMDKVDGADNIDPGRYYWTASQSSASYAYYVNITDGGGVYNSFSCFGNAKTSLTYARVVLTF